FQSAFELIRLVVRKGWLDKVKLASIVDRLLALHPGEGRYVYDLLAIVIKDVVGPDDGVDGGQPEEKLLSLLADPQSVSINAADAVRPNVADDATFDYFQYDMSMADRDGIVRSLRRQQHTRLSVLAQAVAALDALEKNSSDADARQKLKTALNGFAVDDPAP